MSSYLPPLIVPGHNAKLLFDVFETTSLWGRRRAVRIPWSIYRGDQRWVPPLRSEQHRAVDPARNPMLANTAQSLFLAEARSLSIADTDVASLAIWAEHGSGSGCFGVFECVNEPDLSEALFSQAEGWLNEHLPGLAMIRGPLSLDPLRLPGLLVDGFDTQPAAFVPYNPPYYPEMLVTAGYEPAQAYRAYDADVGTLAASQAPAAASWGMYTTDADGRPSLMDILADICRMVEPGSAGAASGKTPTTMSDSPTAMLTAVLAGGRDEQLGWEGQLAVGWLQRRMLAAVATEEGQPIGAVLGVPDARSGLRWSRGRLLPVGWLPYAASVRWTRWLRVLPAAVLPAWQGQGIELALYRTLAERAMLQGFRTATVGPFSADDRASAQAMLALGARITQTYQLYEKKL